MPLSPLLPRAGAVAVALAGVLAVPAAAAAADPVARTEAAAPAAVTVTAPATAATAAGPAYILSARWERTARGMRLYARPTAWGRDHARYAPRAAWDQARAKAGPARFSAAAWQSLYDQFRCHTVIARDKPTWNVEAWRPNVGYQATMRAFCNP